MVAVALRGAEDGEEAVSEELVDVPAVLGSRSTDGLSGLGPAPLEAGDVLPVGPAPAAPPLLDALPGALSRSGTPVLRVVLGPRDGWFAPGALEALLGSPWVVSPRSDRVGLRLLGPPLQRADTVAGHELPSEGVVRGALQVSPDGAPTLFLADAPVTGGYPVIGYVVDPDLDRCAQLRPGQSLRFRAAA